MNVKGRRVKGTKPGPRWRTNLYCTTPTSCWGKIRDLRGGAEVSDRRLKCDLGLGWWSSDQWRSEISEGI